MQNDPLVKRVRATLATGGFIDSGQTVVVGVSGGVDSVVLLHILLRLGVACHVAHVNYGLRGDQSDGDATFVSDLCDRLELPRTIVGLEAGWLPDGESVQEQARKIRYRMFEETARNQDLRTVAVAHHRDDQVETILLRIFRGTGLRGMGGMRAYRPISEGSEIVLVRPLLDSSRREISEWAAKNGIAFRDDDSNQDNRFDRARVRRIVIPAIREAFGESAVLNIARSASHTRSAYDAVVERRVEADLAAALIRPTPPTLSTESLLRLDPDWRQLILLEAVRRWAPGAPNRTSSSEQIAFLLTAQTGKSISLGDSTVWKGRGTIVFAGSGDSMMSGLPIEAGIPVDLETGTIVIEASLEVSGSGSAGAGGGIVASQSGSFKFDPNTEWVDADAMVEPLTVGPWRPGDRFQPLGMEGTRKVKDFLTDEKVEPHLKPMIPVLRSGDNIVWVVGHRLSHPFRVRPDSRRVAKLRFEPT